MKELFTKFALNTGFNNVKPINGADNDIAGADGAFTKIINWIMGIVGIMCVVVIILGGIQYMTSAGDAGKVKKAKDTILYGIIGLIIVALAAVIVNFVIANVIGS